MVWRPGPCPGPGSRRTQPAPLHQHAIRLRPLRPSRASPASPASPPPTERRARRVLNSRAALHRPAAGWHSNYRTKRPPNGGPAPRTRHRPTYSKSCQLPHAYANTDLYPLLSLLLATFFYLTHTLHFRCLSTLSLMSYPNIHILTNTSVGPR